MRIERNCLQCGRVILVKPSVIAKGSGKFCSRSCANVKGTTLEEKLESLTSRKPGVACWLYCGAVHPVCGYGRFQWGGKCNFAHRIAYLVANGAEPPAGMMVLHSCDNRLCINPSHLRAGTHQDNMNDMVSRGRQATGDRHSSRTKPECVPRGIRNARYTHPERTARGSRHARAIFTEAQVFEIKRLFFARIITNKAELARLFRCSEGTIQSILAGRTWRHVTFPPLEP